MTTTTIPTPTPVWHVISPADAQSHAQRLAIVWWARHRAATGQRP